MAVIRAGVYLFKDSAPGSTPAIVIILNALLRCRESNDPERLSDKGFFSLTDKDTFNEYTTLYYLLKISKDRNECNFVHRNRNLIGADYEDSLSAGYDHTIRFWEALSGICSRTIQHPGSQVNRLCISPDKKFLAAAGHHTVKLYEIKSTNPNPALTFEGHSGNITGVAFHCEGKWMVTSSDDGYVKIWETRTGTVQRSYNHNSPVTDVVIHPNQGEIISCDRDGSVRIWDLAENSCSHQLIPEEKIPVASVTIATDGTILCAGTNSGNVYVWHLEFQQDKTSIVPITHFTAHSNYITRVLLSPDVKHLATCSADHTAKIWEVKSLEGGNLNHGDSEFNKNNPRPFKLESTLTGHQRWVWDCAFSADSAYLVTACSDHYARLWELSSEQIIRQYNGHHRGLVCVALNDYSETR
ncbi:Target of rapamycin complex subunit LST8 [Golovinomyces cichoracearum]|uniref:Target of rapamycin complex subunit LST8 n=1 Tax=Golovinomyces cichoracearum TaxID=62708 RepID=A0A420J5N6_9PEZI|nr:Target of rapamycin complex subunit LST8 [Golovinomyces cichoracearum]